MYAETTTNWYSSDPSLNFAYNANYFPSPLDPARMLKNNQAADTVCVPTHQLFDVSPPSPASPMSPHMNQIPELQPRLSISIKPPVSPLKRSPSPVATTAVPQPKKRCVGERISTKDFIPPDVSGLSKREARLVKNRAAAFLSRQRKREEFETMEVRVTELEKENSRLLALTQDGNSSAISAQPSGDSQAASTPLVSEIESLKSQLEALRQREALLAAKLAESSNPTIKLEETCSDIIASPRPSSSCSTSSSSSQSLSKSSATSLSLMVLLCAMPSLLALQSGQSTAVPTNFQIPTAIPTSPSGSSAPFDFNNFGVDQYDWSRTGADGSPSMAVSTTQRLQFSNLPGPNGEELDISFSASPSEDGKIRVTIHNAPESTAPSVVSSRSTSPGFTASALMKPEPEPMEIYDHLTPPGMTFSDASSASGSSNGLASPSLSATSVYSTHSPNDPFLGVGSSSPSTEFSFNTLNSFHGRPETATYPSYSTHSGLEGALDYEYSQGRRSEFKTPSAAETPTQQRRVRIALKSLPEAGDGGEWEVEFC